jgi:Tlde1 domain
VKIDSTTVRVLGKGYAGHNFGLNNPEWEDVEEDYKAPSTDNAGPLPAGNYSIGQIGTHYVTAPDGTKYGLQLSMRLSPDKDNQMFGRSGFLMHKGSMTSMADSQGCIVEPPETLSAIGNSGIKNLEVVH